MKKEKLTAMLKHKKALVYALYGAIILLWVVDLLSILPAMAYIDMVDRIPIMLSILRTALTMAFLGALATEVS